MKIVDAYNNFKINYKEYVVLIKSGIFYEVYNDDVGIMYSLFNYKIKLIGNNYNIGFPSNSITKVCNELDCNKINYIVVESHDGKYVVMNKKRFNKNGYKNYLVDLAHLNYMNHRVNSIVEKLHKRIFDENTEQLIEEIEKLI